MKVARSRYHGIILFAVLSGVSGSLTQQAYALEPGVGAEVRIESQRSLANAIADLKKNPGLTEASFDVSTNAQVKRIAELPQIRTLNLYVRADNLDLSPLQRLRNLERLNLALFNQTSEPDKWLSVLPRLRSLRSLELYHSQPTNAVKKRIVALPAMSKLQTLSLKSFGDTVYDFAPSFNSSKLITLELAAPAIANQAVMSKFNKLETLILGNNFRLNNSGKVALQQVRTLRHLAAPRAENLPLESWSHLRTVTLGDTSAMDLLRLSRLPQLESITAKLQKDCADSHLLRLAQLHGLKSLDIEVPSHFKNGSLVASTKLTGSGLGALSPKGTLTKLTVRGLALSEPLLAAASKINSLRSLEITAEEVALTPALAKHLNKLKNLEELAVPWSENSMIAVLKECPNLTKLTSLQLRKQNLKDGDLSILSNYPAVTRLDLSENNLTDDCLIMLSTMTHLSELQLSGNKAITAKTFGTLAKLPALKSLFLNNTAITDEAMRAIKLNTSALTLLDLSQTKVGKQALRAITTLPNLKRLALSDTAMTDASVNNLRSGTLEELNLDSTEITEHGINRLASMPRLRTVSAYDTGIKYGAIMPASLAVSKQVGWHNYNYDSPRKQPEQAKNASTSSLPDQPTDENLLALAQRYHLQKDYDKAVDAYSKAIHAIEHPDHYVCSILSTEHSHKLFEAHDGRGLALAASGQHEKALADLNRAVGIAKASANARTHRGLILSKLGRHNEAIKDLNRAIEIKPSLAAAYDYRSAVYTALGKHSLASEDKSMSTKLHTASELVLKPNPAKTL